MERDDGQFNPEDEEASMRSYLLGELSDEEQTRLEERCFGDERLSLRLRAVRDDLIDAYVRDELPRRERDRFERHFMASPPRRERVEVARALIESLDRAEVPAWARPGVPTPGAWWRSLLDFGMTHRRALATAAVLVAVAAGVWVASRGLRTADRGAPPGEGQVAREQGDPGEPRSDPGRQAGNKTTPEPAPQSPRPQTGSDQREQPAPRSQPVVATFVLVPNSVRDSGGAQKLMIPRRAELVRLRLSTEGGDYESYRVRLRTPEGVEVWSRDRIKVRPKGSYVVVNLPAGVFSSRDYTLTLSGSTAGAEPTDVAKYYFRVERK